MKSEEWTEDVQEKSQHGILDMVNRRRGRSNKKCEISVDEMEKNERRDAIERKFRKIIEDAFPQQRVCTGILEMMMTMMIMMMIIIMTMMMMMKMIIMLMMIMMMILSKWC